MKQSPAQTGLTLRMKRRQEDVLELVAGGAHLTVACRRVGMSPVTVYRHWRRTDWWRRYLIAVQQGAVARGDETFVSARKAYFGHDSADHHLLIVDAIERATPGSVTMILAPPEGGKTTVLTDYYNIELGENPDARICVVCRDLKLSRKIGGQVRRRMSDRAMFGDYINRYGPFVFSDDERKRGGSYERDFARPWNADFFTVRRATHDEKDPSFESLGVGSEIYGARYDLICFDDVQTLKNLVKAEEFVEWLQQEVITRLSETGRVVILGTRVANGDFYEKALATDGLVDDLVKIKAIDHHGQSYWPERWPLERLQQRRNKIGEERWQRVFMQATVSKVGASFRESSIKACLDRSRPLRAGAAGLGRLGSVDPALTGHAAFGVYDYDVNRLALIDMEDHVHLGSNEGIFVQLVRLTNAHGPPDWVIEQDGQGNKALINDDRLAELGRDLGFRVHPHLTTGNKMAEAYGVAQMDGAFRRGEISLPYGDEAARKIVDELIDQLLRWRPDVPARLLRQDLVMQLWFAWRWWRDRRRVLAQSAAAFDRPVPAMFQTGLAGVAS